MPVIWECVGACIDQRTGGTAMVTLGLSLGLLMSIARVKKLVKT